jgi:signal peptidase I
MKERRHQLVGFAIPGSPFAAPQCSFVGHNPRRTLKVLLLVLVLVLVIRNWVWMPALIVGESMAPVLHDRQVIIVNKLAYLFRPPARGEIVCIWTGAEYITKRIIGLPGEEVALRAGKLQVDSKPWFEPYLEDPGDLEILPGRISADTYAVIGDKRSDTVLAVVSRRRIVGKVVCANLPRALSFSTVPDQTVEQPQVNS